VGSEGEIWRHQQLHLQLPPHDTHPEKCVDLTSGEIKAHAKLDDIRLTTSFDVGEVVQCPDFGRPDSCGECGLKEDGFHWAYCSAFLEPDPVKRAKVAGISKSKSPKVTLKGKKMMSEEEYYADGASTSIKSMRKASQAATLVPPAMVGDPLDELLEVASAVAGPAGRKCLGCMEPLFIGEPVVSCGRFHEERETYLHPRCFACSECGELLVDLRAFIDFGKEERGKPGAEKRLFCGRHWAENRVSRCAACDEVILQRDSVYEFGRAYHVRHFCCTICDANLTQLDIFVPRGRKPYCFPCFGAHFADKCSGCRQPINPMPGHGGKVSVAEKHWHASCFKCKMCDDKLDGKPAIPRSDGVYCKPCLKKKLKAEKRDRNKTM
jgi:prickle